ncbi:MAG: MFS transporter [Clostridia bacterium]|nr:MFS transporter [Clostridia bacterium]
MKNKTNLIFLHNIIKAFADSMVKAFVPLIILQNTGNMMLVMLYLCVFYVVATLLNYVLKKFLEKYGVIAIILHIFPIIAMQFLLTLPTSWWLCIVLGLCAGLDQALYYVPLNILFSFTDKTANVAKFQIAICVGKLFFILLSGYVLGSGLQNSLLWLCVIATLLYIASVIPILYGFKLLKQQYCKAAENSQKTYDKKTYITFNLFHMFMSVFKTTLEVIVPLYLFVNNLSFSSIAIFLALIELCKIAVNVLSKFLLKKSRSWWGIVLACVLFVAGFVMILFVKNQIVLYVASCVISITYPLVHVPTLSVFLKKVEADGNQFDGLVMRDVYIQMAKPVLFVPYFVFPSLVGQFVVGIGATIGMIFASKKFLK